LRLGLKKDSSKLKKISPQQNDFYGSEIFLRVKVGQ
jgi:hypothetical protein